MKTTKFLALGIAAAVAATGTQALASGDGEKLFKRKCGTCHTMQEGNHRIGPSLAGVVGRQAGTTDFGRYKALEGADIVWTEENLDAWIADPKKFIGSPTAMTVKVRKDDEREAIIDYLKGDD